MSLVARNAHFFRRDFTLPHQVLTTAKGIMESFLLASQDSAEAKRD
jgi:hypothetical protein